MTFGRRIWSGTGLGILAATLATPAMFTFFGKPEFLLHPSRLLTTLFFALLILTIFAGPGALVLSWIHAEQMERWARRARTVRDIRQLGVLLGMPLGVANLVLVVTAVALIFGKFSPEVMLTPAALVYLIPAVAGGAGLGWGVCIGLRPGRAPAKRPLPRPRLRRDGPPFFDKRPARRTT
jgi:hypothetical protein